MMDHDRTAKARPQNGRAIAHEDPGILFQVHRLLRGRYVPAVLSAVVLGAAGGLAAWHFTPPQYTSTGSIRIAPAVPKVLYQSEAAGTLPDFDAFVALQASLITTEPVVQLAMQSPHWENLQGQDGQRSRRFAETVDVDRPKKSQLMTVIATDPDPDVAKTAALSLMEAYMDLHGNAEERQRKRRMEVLQVRRDYVYRRLEGQRKRLLELTAGLGNEALETTFNAAVQRMKDVENAYWHLTNHTAPEPAPSPVNDERAWLRNELQRQETKLQLELAELRRTLGPEHSAVQRKKQTLIAVSELLVSMQRTTMPMLPQTNELPTEVELAEALKQAKSQVEELALRRQHIQDARAEIERNEAFLRDAEQAMEQARVEAEGANRITIETWPRRANSPSNGRDRIRTTAAAVVCGAAAGFGIVLLVSMRDYRCRGVADAAEAMGSDMFLGILPKLPPDITDPRRAMVGALGVHEIRCSLGRSNGSARRVIGITSAMPGAGKTSLTMALGLSFAASGSRTLLVDLDFVGTALTRRIHAIRGRRIGSALRERGLINQDELNAALAVSRNENRRIGEVLTERRWVSPEALDEALEAQQSGTAGVLDALYDSSPEDFTIDTGIDNLAVLPAGSAGTEDISRISEEGLRKLFDGLRQRFDVVLVDTGPALGSVEASLVCIAADEVVLVTARGEDRRKLTRVLRRLSHLGATLAGVVFNRAAYRDVERYGSQLSVAPPLATQGRGKRTVPGIADYGPLAQATAAVMPAIRSGVAHVNGNGHHSENNGNGTRNGHHVDV